MNSDKIEYKHESEANISGLILLSHNKIGPTKLYKVISCGHEKRLQRGQVSPEAPVARDPLGVVRAVRTVGQGDVEVRPDQPGPPGDLEVVE